jgi:ABC-2 type transport system permease protein
MSPRLFLHVMSLEVRRTLTYRADFWIQALLTFLAELALAWFLWRGVFDASGATTIGGLTFEGAVRYTVLVVLLGKLTYGGGTGQEGAIAQDIYDGSFSRYRVYPVSFYAFKYAQNLGRMLPAVVQTLLFGGVWLLLQGPGGFEGLSAGSVAQAFVAVALANLLQFAISWPIQGVAFWAENVWSLMVALRFVQGLLGGMLLPLSIFPSGVRPLLDLLPFRYLFSFPVEVLTGQVTGWAFVEGCALALGWWCVFRLVGAWVWRRGGLAYSGAGM